MAGSPRLLVLGLAAFAYRLQCLIVPLCVAVMDVDRESWDQNRNSAPAYALIGVCNGEFCGFMVDRFHVNHANIETVNGLR